jgi:hypothetical protein
MIKNIIDLLQIDNFYGKNERINLAKGKYLYPRSLKEMKEMIKRNWNG